MSVYLSPKYSDRNSNRFPNSNINPEDKKKLRYCVDKTKAIYSTFMNNGTSFPTSMYSQWDLNRLYAKGKQSQDQYKEQLDIEDAGLLSTDTDNETGRIVTLKDRRKGWMNVDWSILSIAPKIKDHFHGLFDNTDFDVLTDCVDEVHGAEMEQAKINLLREVIFRKQLQEIRQMAGVPDVEPNFIPQDAEELEIYAKNGGFKLQVAKAMEKLLKHTFNISDWDQIKHKLLDDAVDLGVIALMDEFDEDTQIVKTKYCDPARMIIQYSNSNDFDDSEYGAYIDEMSITKLQQKGFDRDQLLQIAKAHTSYNNVSWNSSFEQSDNNGWAYDWFKIPVLKCVWIEADTEKYATYTNKFGKPRIKDAEWTENESSNKKIKSVVTRYTYRCSWIIDTDLAFDYGIDYNQIRPTPSTVVLPFRAIKVSDTPIMRRLIPALDGIQRTWVKYQNAEAMAVNAGFSLNVRLMNNLSMGGQKLSLGAVIKFMTQTGIVLYSDTPLDGQYTGGSVNPVTPLPGGMREQLSDAIQKFNLYMKMVEDLTGLSPLALGGTPSPGTGKANTEASLQATQTVIAPIFNSCMKLKANIAEDVILRIQMLLRTNNKNAIAAYKRVVGEDDINLMKTAEGKAAQYGISLVSRPNTNELQFIYKAMEMALAPTRNGKSSIELDDYIMMQEMISNGANIKDMHIRLSSKIRKNREIGQQEAMQIMEQQSQQNQQLEAMKQKGEQVKYQMEVEKEIAIDNNKTNNILKVKTFDTNVQFKQSIQNQMFAEENAKMQANLQLKNDVTKGMLEEEDETNNNE